MTTISKLSPRWPGLRLRATCAIVALAALSSLGCVEAIKPAGINGNFHLADVNGDAPPTVLFEDASSRIRTYGETLHFNLGGTGTLTSVRTVQSLAPLGAEQPQVTTTTDFTYRILGSEVDITLACPPGAVCSGDPQLVGIITLESFVVVTAMNQRVPQRYDPALPTQ